MGLYLRPASLDDALSALAERPYTILAGGTDFYPARVGRPLTEDVLDVTGLAGLAAIEEGPDHWRIGAGVTWTQAIEADLPPLFHGLKMAAREVGGVQIQNAGTIAGNVCNASPAADGIPVLMSLEAEVELAGRDGAIRMPLERFVTGPRRTALGPAQIVTALRIPKRPGVARTRFAKLGARRYLVISIVAIGFRLDLEAGGRIAGAGIAVGACAATARRLTALEQELRGEVLRPGIGRMVAARHVADLAPIDDIRGSAGYRLDAAQTLLARGLEAMAEVPP